MTRNLANRLWQSFLQINLYKNSSSDAQKIPGQRIATRIYICSLMVFTLMIATGSAFVFRTANIIEYSPSPTKFSQLINRYPSTLHCPCTVSSIRYDTFVTIDVSFHQVCSSQFIEQKWIDMILAEQQNLSMSSDDFRTTLTYFWQTMVDFCDINRATWNDIMASFNESHTFNPAAVAEEGLRTQVQATLNNHINSARTVLKRNLLVIRRTTRASQFVSALKTNFYLRYPPQNFSLQSSPPQMSPRIFNHCSCLNLEGCPHPATINETHNNAITVPGMIADCLIIDGILASTLECYYDQTCLSLLHQSLPTVITPLLNGFDKNFMKNFTIELLLNQLMVDEITSKIRFDLYYSQCNSSYCAYSYSRRFDILFIITTIIGVFGGLSLILRLIAPFIATMILRWRNRAEANNNLPDATVGHQNKLHIVFNRLRLLPNYIRRKLMNLNLFESQTPCTPAIIFRQQLLTRFFIFLIIISSIVIGFYIFLSVEDQVVTIAHPSLTTYTALYNNHSDTLHCPCSQTSVSYEAFLNITFILHEVCSSDFVSPAWLNYLASLDPIVVVSSAKEWDVNDFRTIGVSYFEFLATFCSLAESNIEDAQRLFADTQYINDDVLTSAFFNQQTQATIESYINAVRNDFKYMIDWIKIIFSTSYILTGTNTNFALTVGANDTFTIVSRRYATGFQIIGNQTENTDYCSCGRTSSSCLGATLLYKNESVSIGFAEILRELPTGCIPLTGFLSSTFAWWYNETYVKNIQATYAVAIQSPSSLNITPINALAPSRFFGQNKLTSLVEEMFLEGWISNSTYFNQFYSNCAPISCSYTTRRRRDLIVGLLLLISICGGLNKILRIVVPSLGKLIFFSIDWWKNRHAEHPLVSTTVRLKHLFSTIYQSTVNINLYKTTSIDGINEQQQKTYTRIYLILFLGSLGVLLFYTAIISRSVTRKYLQPSVENYEQLLAAYPDGVKCACTRLSLPYNEFITELRVNRYHQACSTTVIYLVLTIGDLDPPDPIVNKKDFRNFKQDFIDTVKQLCALAQQRVNNRINILNASTMLVSDIISRSQFNNEMNNTLNGLEINTPIEFARTLQLMRTTIQGNALIALSPENWNLVVDEQGQGRNASFHCVPISYNDAQQNRSCSCATSRTCTMPAQIFSSKNQSSYTCQGLVLGCYILETVLLSSLSCFYSAACIDDLRHKVVVFYSNLQNYQMRTGLPVQLDASLTRFGVNDTIETLAYGMFIESWTTNVSYERFFNSCAPSYCTYTFHYRFDTLALLTTFLSVYSGLSLGIRFIVPYLVKIIKKIRNRFRITPLQ